MVVVAADVMVGITVQWLVALTEWLWHSLAGVVVIKVVFVTRA